ncbi:hypothetical protein LA6_003945 [Marinibacterium anthonyi]|nr:hypothetical protein LA6_003945 [Marinibacterium anthonyi]
MDFASRGISRNATGAYVTLREAALAEAATALASLQTEVENAASEAIDWLVGSVFTQGRLRSIEIAFNGLQTQRGLALNAIPPETDAYKLLSLGLTALDVGLAPPNEVVDPRHLFVAVDDPSQSIEEIYEEKARVLREMKDNEPGDRLAAELEWIEGLNGTAKPKTKTHVLRAAIASWTQDPTSLSAVQIADLIAGTLENVVRADLSINLDFSTVRDLIKDQIRQIIPTSLSTRMTVDLPIRSFKGIFEPEPGGLGTLAARSVSTISLGVGGAPDVTASAEATLSPFSIRLLGGFDAITLYFSEARMGWTAGQDPTFSIDFLDYKIGKELAFVENVAQSLSANSGGAYIAPARTCLGIEAGYRLNVGAINLGGVTFLNVGLGASAILPFENRKALFAASLSSRASPFIIIAGVWGRGGHFTLTSDGRRIVGFEASFVFGGGGGVGYGPLTLQGRVTVGIFARKAGSYTTIMGDFFVGGSGQIGLFGVSASLMVTMGMDGSGAMVGSAVFTFSFKVAFARVSFSITVFKKEGKGFSGSGSQQARLMNGAGRTRYADLLQAVEGDAPASGARIRVDTQRQDQDYRVWRGYFSQKRSRRYRRHGY